MYMHIYACMNMSAYACKYAGMYACFVSRAVINFCLCAYASMWQHVYSYSAHTSLMVAIILSNLFTHVLIILYRYTYKSYLSHFVASSVYIWMISSLRKPLLLTTWYQ